MAEPIFLWFYSAQGGVAFYVTGIGFAAIADEDDVALLGGVAVVADPVHVLLLRALVVELSRFYFELFSLVPEVVQLQPAVGAVVGGFEPFL
jgi:hypothetical protein